MLPGLGGDVRAFLFVSGCSNMFQVFEPDTSARTCCGCSNMVRVFQHVAGVRTFVECSKRIGTICKHEICRIKQGRNNIYICIYIYIYEDVSLDACSFFRSYKFRSFLDHEHVRVFLFVSGCSNMSHVFEDGSSVRTCCG